MIVFWKFLFSEDFVLYEKDPTAPVNNASEITPFSPSSGAKAINYCLGIFFVFPWMISTFLNPLLYCHFRTTKTKASSLFKCLAATDFLTDLWPPLVYTYVMLTPQLYPSSHTVLRYARTWTCLIGCFSQIIGFLLAVSRSIKIVFPFCNFKYKYVLMYQVGYFVYMIVNNVTYFVTEFFQKDAKVIKLLKIGLDLCLWANFAHCCAGLSISLFTVVYLYSSTR